MLTLFTPRLIRTHTGILPIRLHIRQQFPPPIRHDIKPESNAAVADYGQLLKRIVRTGIVEDVHVIAQWQRLSDQLERSGYPADDFVVTAFADALRNARLIER